MSSRNKNSLIDLKSISHAQVESLFSVADQISENKKLSFKGSGLTGALLFFESSTRTRMSFETACARLGIHPLLLDGKSGSSLEKGETLEDTVLNVNAMGPSFLVIRSGDGLDFSTLQEKVHAPIFNAGWGQQGHPTQALLDAYTIREHRGSCKNQKLLIVGDIRHSRVAASHLELAQVLDYEVGFCGPKEFLPEASHARSFASLQEGLKWCTVAMALRVQIERHTHQYSLADYRDAFGFNQKNILNLGSQALIMHPGPINQGTELDTDILSDPRCRVLNQVANGVLIRQALIYTSLTEDRP